jgi:hypothetical protein
VPPKAKLRCSQPKLIAAQPLIFETTEVISKMAAWLGQAQAASLYSEKQSAVDASRSARDPFPLASCPLRDIQLVFTNLTFLAERGAVR